MDMNARINLFACANDFIGNFNSLNKENQFTVILQLDMIYHNREWMNWNLIMMNITFKV